MMRICFANQLEYRLFINIYRMFTIAMQALPLGILAAIVTFIIMVLWEKMKGPRLKRGQRWDFVLFSAYLMVLFEITIFSRTIGSVDVIDLIPFNTPGGIRYILLFAMANVVMFIPFGILAPKIFKVLRSPKRCFALGFLTSVSIELIQFVLKCGVVQTEDVITNIIGIEIGYWIYEKWIK